MPASQQTDLLFRSLMAQNRVNTTCSTNSKSRNPIATIIIKLFTAASLYSTIRWPKSSTTINAEMGIQDVCKR